MSTSTAWQRAGMVQMGQPVRLRLLDDHVFEGILIRMDGRTLRLRPAGRGGLIVLARQAVTDIVPVLHPAA